MLAIPERSRAFVDDIALAQVARYVVPVACDDEGIRVSVEGLGFRFWVLGFRVIESSGVELTFADALALLWPGFVPVLA